MARFAPYLLLLFISSVVAGHGAFSAPDSRVDQSFSHGVAYLGHDQKTKGSDSGDRDKDPQKALVSRPVFAALRRDVLPAGYAFASPLSSCFNDSCPIRAPPLA